MDTDGSPSEGVGFDLGTRRHRTAAAAADSVHRRAPRRVDPLKQIHAQAPAQVQNDRSAREPRVNTHRLRINIPQRSRAAPPKTPRPRGP